MGMSELEIRSIHRALLLLKKRNPEKFNLALSLSREEASGVHESIVEEAVSLIFKLREDRKQRILALKRPNNPHDRSHILGHREIPYLSPLDLEVRLKHHTQNEYTSQGGVENSKHDYPLSYVRYPAVVSTPKEGLAPDYSVPYGWKKRLPGIVGLDLKQKGVQLTDALPVGDGIFFARWLNAGHGGSTGLCSVINGKLRVFPNPTQDATIHGQSILSINRLRRRKA